MKIRYGFLILVFIGAIVFIYYNRPIEKNYQVMGTTVRIKINDWFSGNSADQAFQEIKRLDKLFSRFDKESDVGRLKERNFVPSADTIKCLELADKVKKLSGGAFDVSSNQTAWDIDLGGIGKGYAVEAARQLLLKRGVKSAIIDMHSSMAVIGDGWRIGIKGGNDVVVLNDGDALATSGQYEQPGHIIDPRNGKPADKCQGVTVIAKDAGLADALSTAIFVLGPEEGRRLADKLQVGVIIYENSSTQLR
ncbi:MAG: FAD:protein FMN transferase [bacterium]